MALALSACQCGPVALLPDGGDDEVVVPRKPDSGVVVLPPDGPVTRWPETFASEPCPAEAFGLEVDGGAVNPDAGLRFGICIALRTLTADAFLDNVVETKPVKVQFLAGGFQSELTRVPDPQGLFQVKVMRSRYDILQHQPGGVWPYFEGFIDHGYADMTKDLQSNFRATSHLLRGAVRFGGLAFTPSIFPQDVWFDAYGTPSWQRSMVTSQGGSYELRMLEGTFGLFLNTPAASLFGTELRKFPVTPTRNLTFDRDQEYDIDIASSVLEASITIDGEPLPDARPGTDFTITYTRPGDTDATVFSHHEGGLAGFTSLIPKGAYGTTLDFQGVPNRTLPTRIFGKSLQQSVDLRNDTGFAIDFSTHAIEGSILIDGVPPRPNPNYNFQMYLFGAAGATAGSSFLMYEIPLDSSSFRIKAFPGNYFTILSLDEGLSEDLASGFWVVDRYFQLQADRSMPIAIDTARFTGRITIDGKTPVPGRRVGTFTFRNRAMQGQYSFFMKGFETAEDGTFSVKLPKGEYEVYFTIDRETYPDYASGRQLIFSRVPLDQDVSLDINYETLEISGPLRVGGEVVQDTIGGAEVGLRLQRQQDFQNFDWRFQGGKENYVLRVPKGSYALDFVIFENAIDGVAFGNAPMGLKLNVAQAGEPFMNFGR
ncbi:MAG: hypothetical protein Q8L48_28305 [Archangium sp.]|nr:hypothetical protein [Archangium sp.]